MMDFLATEDRDGAVHGVGVVLRVRSKLQKISPKRAAEMLAANTSNRLLSKATARSFAEAMRRRDWLVTHQGITFDTAGLLVDGQHRLAVSDSPWSTGRDWSMASRRGRLGGPDDVAAAVCFLASAEAGWITGQTVDVNGGMFMN